MKNLLSALSLAALFISCQPGKNTTPAPQGTTLLTKIVDSLFDGVNAPAVNSTTFTYDKSNRLSEMLFENIGVASPYQLDYLFTRDGQGRVTTLTRKIHNPANGLPGNVDEDLLAQFFYQGETNNVNYYILYTADKPEKQDSVVLTYTGDNVTGMHAYDLTQNNQPTLVDESTFDFDNTGQLTASSTSIQDPTARTYYTIQPDGKINPLKFGAEALVVDFNYMSSGNPLIENRDDPGENFTLVNRFSYSYRADGRPLRASSSSDGGVNTKVSTYYYSN